MAVLLGQLKAGDHLFASLIPLLPPPPPKVFMRHNNLPGVTCVTLKRFHTVS